MATIDVFIPCYRYGRFLAQCADSVLSQTGPAVRVLIIDDASPDETPDIARQLTQRDDRVTYVRHAVNRGHIATYNEGLAWATADYTLLLSADDWLLPGALDRAAALLDANPTVGFVYGSAIELHDDSVLPPLHPPTRNWTILSTEEFLRANRHSNPVPTCTAVVRTAAQKRIGGYRPELPHAGDMEMWMRFAAHGPVGRIEANQGVYRRHAANMSIGYHQDMMSDLRQRKGAIDNVLQDATSELRDRHGMRRMLYRGLAESAVSGATALQAGGANRQFSEIMRFAADLDPTIRRTLAWRKQYIKRWLGPRLCSRAASVRTMLRARMAQGR